MCDELIAPPLKIIFDTALKSGIYPDKWKRANVVPVHKKESKNILNNYRPISLLPICEIFFEKCIYNSLYSYLIFFSDGTSNFSVMKNSIVQHLMKIYF